MVVVVAVVVLKREGMMEVLGREGMMNRGSYGYLRTQAARSTPAQS